MERKRRRTERTLAWKRTIQLHATVAEAGMALRLRQRRWIRVRGSWLRPRARLR